MKVLFVLRFCIKQRYCTGPGRTELERMKQFKNNQDDEFSSFSPNPPLLGNKGKSSPELEPYSRPKSPKQATGNPRYEKIEQSLGLGELDGLTILNEAELGGMAVSNLLFVLYRNSLQKVQNILPII